MDIIEDLFKYMFKGLFQFLIFKLRPLLCLMRIKNIYIKTEFKYRLSFICKLGIRTASINRCSVLWSHNNAYRAIKLFVSKKKKKSRNEVAFMNLLMLKTLERKWED